MIKDVIVSTQASSLNKAYKDLESFTKNIKASSDGLVANEDIFTLIDKYHTVLQESMGLNEVLIQYINRKIEKKGK